MCRLIVISKEMPLPKCVFHSVFRGMSDNIVATVPFAMCGTKTSFLPSYFTTVDCKLKTINITGHAERSGGVALCVYIHLEPDFSDLQNTAVDQSQLGHTARTSEETLQVSGWREAETEVKKI